MDEPSPPSPTLSPSQRSPSTTVTTPEQSPGLDEDIWDTTSDHGHDLAHGGNGDEDAHTLLLTGSASDAQSHGQNQRILSDVPSMRRQHMTAGYREGLSVWKARVMQAGFDTGYPFGVEIGMRVGTVLGVLEGLVAASASASGKKNRMVSRPVSTSTSSLPPRELRIESAEKEDLNADDKEERKEDHDHDPEEDAKFVRTLLERAQRELKIAEMMKALDDETVARLQAPDSSPAPGPTATAAAAAAAAAAASAVMALPEEIEEVVRRWEVIVLGALGTWPGGEGQSQSESRE